MVEVLNWKFLSVFTIGIMESASEDSVPAMVITRLESGSICF